MSPSSAWISLPMWAFANSMVSHLMLSRLPTYCPWSVGMIRAVFQLVYDTVVMALTLAKTRGTIWMKWWLKGNQGLNTIAPLIYNDKSCFWFGLRNVVITWNKQVMSTSCTLVWITVRSNLATCGVTEAQFTNCNWATFCSILWETPIYLPCINNYVWTSHGTGMSAEMIGLVCWAATFPPPPLSEWCTWPRFLQNGLVWEIKLAYQAQRGNFVHQNSSLWGCRGLSFIDSLIRSSLVLSGVLDCSNHITLLFLLALAKKHPLV
jgi:hypothetical protein